MADNTQQQIVLLPHQEMTHPATLVGSASDVSTMLGGLVYLWQANIETTANLGAGLDYIDIQVSPDASGNNWASLMKLVPSTTAASDEIFTATEPIGETVFAVTSTTGFDAGDLIYCKDLTSVATSEWHEVASIVANTSITSVDGLAVAKVATDDVMYDQASRWAVFVDLSGVRRIRVVVKHQGSTGSDWRVYAVLEVVTDIE